MFNPLAFGRRLAHLPPMLAHFPGNPTDFEPPDGDAADFRHVETWLFDLDNTLYASDARVLKAIEGRIGLFVQQELALNEAQALTLQKAYYREYGTTLAGLMRHHGTDPESYLAFVNAVDSTELKPDPALAAELARLPGRRFVFTNNCGHHAERVLARLGLTDLFDDIWDVRSTGFIPKPMEGAFHAVIAKGRLVPARAAMFDDLADNLRAAHALGMTTVWLRPEPPAQTPLPHVHHQTHNLPAFLHRIEVATAS